MGANSPKLVTAAPGFIVARRREEGEAISPGGIILPTGSSHLPIVRVLNVGPVRPSEEEWWAQLGVEEGMLIVVKSADCLLNFGYDRIYIVSFDDIVAKVEWD